MIASITFDDISPLFLSLPQLKRLCKFLDETAIKCTLFIVPFGYENCSSDYLELLKNIGVCGHELALHGYEHIKNEFGYFPLPSFFPFPTFKMQEQRIEKGIKGLADLAEVRPLGFRAPFYLHNNATFKALSKLGFVYDSSKTIFKPTHGLRFRMRWQLNIRPFTKENILEIPVTGDYTYNLNNGDFTNAINTALHDCEWIRSKGGVFVLNNHPQRFDECRYRFLKNIVKKLSKKTKFVRLIDVTRKWGMKPNFRGGVDNFHE